MTSDQWIFAGFVAFVMLVVVLFAWAFWSWRDDRGQWRLLHAKVGTPWILQRKSYHPLPFGASAYWMPVGEFETEVEALVAMRETILREDPSVEAEFDSCGRPVQGGGTASWAS